MINEYNDARKLAKAAEKAALRFGHSPYLPVLDEIEEVKNAVGEVHLGLIELPLDRITGNKSAGRRNAFANNFMPLLQSGTEFAVKWSTLYTSYLREGIRDAIKVYEFMNQYYVQEGNKRVSVSKFGGSEFILADVTRIVPKRTDDKDVVVYYEYLEFYKSTKNIHIIFTQPHSYEKLADILGQKLGERWSKELCEDLKAAYFSFIEKCASAVKIPHESTMGDAFLVYISIFPMRSLFQDTKETIISNIRMARRELFFGLNTDAIEFVTQAPDQEVSARRTLFSGSKRYTAASPLRVGFIYDADIESSRWIDTHESGRLYIDQVTENNVVTNCYYASNDLAGAFERAVTAKNDLIFAVSPAMLPETLRAAVAHPEISFFNCCIGKPHPMVRCYHGKLYEAAFLTGILAADTLLREYPDAPRRIGYLVRSADEMSAATVNAFAVGASLIDPDCRIAMESVSQRSEEDIRNQWHAEKIMVAADIEYPPMADRAHKPGIYKWLGESSERIATPYFHWGRYYEQIVQSMLSGAWRAAELVDETASRNYWFGLSTGVVAVHAPKLPYQTKKLLEFFQSAIVSGAADPFSGELHAQERVIQAGNGGTDLAEQTLSTQDVVSMKWLNENIDGALDMLTAR